MTASPPRKDSLVTFMVTSPCDDGHWNRPHLSRGPRGHERVLGHELATAALIAGRHD